MTASFSGGPPGALVLSLDLELHWGVRDKHPPHGRYAGNLRGAREVVPRILELFEEFGVAATWATVGFLFAGSRKELEEWSPSLRPAYLDDRLRPYSEPVGADEEDDPLHFAPSLIRRIQAVPHQEIATHTFSHYLCGEEGQSPEAFRADLDAAGRAAERHGLVLSSIVFPRNQHNPAYDHILREMGIRAYRGNPRSRFWRFGNGRESSRASQRAGRLLDAYLGTGDTTVGWNEVLQRSGLSDVRASAMLAPYRPALRHLERLRLARVLRRLRYAARNRKILHLWWHPHNFGVHQEENLRFLRGILSELATCRERHGMESLTMAEVDAHVRSAPDPPDSAKQRAGGSPRLSRSRAIS